MEPQHKPEISPRTARELAVDQAAFVILLFFGLLSCGPLAGVFLGGGVWKMLVNGVFLATSLWGLLGIAFILRWLMTSEYRQRTFGISRRPAAIYAFVWCSAYLIYIQLLA